MTRTGMHAHAETVKTTSAFRGAYQSRRCLVPADAFYEWKANGKTKQPYAIAMRDRQPFAFAGLWETWKDPKINEWVRTFAILTTSPNELVASLHDRMPVILAKEGYDRWLGDEPDPGDLIRPYPADRMTSWPVSTRVNTPKNDDPYDPGSCRGEAKLIKPSTRPRAGFLAGAPGPASVLSMHRCSLRQ
jgi:putative SOS response-associated peptidase YedK